jgi:hypothetical protein
MAAIDTSGAGPASRRAGLACPSETPASGPVAPAPPSIRSSQPVRIEVPGAAFSIASIAAKCERVGLTWPTACTAARCPACQAGSSGARAGCSPNVPSPAMT